MSTIPFDWQGAGCLRPETKPHSESIERHHAGTKVPQPNLRRDLFKPLVLEVGIYGYNRAGHPPSRFGDTEILAPVRHGVSPFVIMCLIVPERRDPDEVRKVVRHGLALRQHAHVNVGLLWQHHALIELGGHDHDTLLALGVVDQMIRGGLVIQAQLIFP